MKTINALEQFRKASGLTFDEMARLAGFSSRSAVFQHCTGSRRISAESAIRYSRTFGIPLCQLRPDLWPPVSAESVSEPSQAVTV